MPGMRRLAQFLSFALLVSPVAVTAQILSGETPQVATLPEMSFVVLSDTKGVQLNSYFGSLGPELRQSFRSNLSAADGKASAHQQIDVLLAIDSQGNVSALSLAPGTQDSSVARAAWVAVKDAKYAPLPNGLGSSDLQLRVHFVAP